MKKETGSGVAFPQGFLAAGIHCGIRKNKDKKDLALIYSAVPCSAAAVYTKNRVQGAPLVVTRENLADGRAQAVICNSGIANTCAAGGVEAARRMCAAAADALGISARDVIVASTGVIGQPLPLDAIEAGIPALKKALGKDGLAAATAIMTTDTVPKQASREFSVGGKTVRIGAIAKGSGMIHPDMATLLCFVTTDADISPVPLNEALREAVDCTLNMISIDGDTSTNDMVSIMASGLAHNPPIRGKDDGYRAFVEALTDVLAELSRMLARDGEGATRLLECHVKNAPSLSAARAYAKCVISSSLVKAAFFGADANWGRILCALGYAGLPLDPRRVDVSFSSGAGDIAVCQNGEGLNFDEEKAKAVLSEPTVHIHIDLKDGACCATAFGCDLTYDYVRINGDYRT